MQELEFLKLYKNY